MFYLIWDIPIKFALEIVDFRFQNKQSEAEEIKWKNPKLQEEIQCFFDAYETGFKTSGIETNIEVEYISHKELKNMTRNCKAVIRTGETTPYANIILQSDCIF